MKTAAVLSAVLMAFLLWRILYRWTPAGMKAVQAVRKGINGHDYGRLSGRLVKSGLSDKITPPLYRLIQCILFMTVFLLTVSAGQAPAVAAAAGIAGMLVPGMVVKQRIKAENKKMMADIEHLYNLLHLQRQAGAFFMDSLVDSYRVVSYWRLKKALMDLTGAINNKKPIGEATEAFAEKFDNPHITVLADIIRHGAEDGNTDAMLGDVAEQLYGIRQTQYVTLEGKQELENTLIMALLFAGIMAGVLYLGISGITGSAGAVFY